MFLDLEPSNLASEGGNLDPAFRLQIQKSCYITGYAEGTEFSMVIFGFIN